MPSESYRYYWLDGAGRLHEPEWFAATSDQEAIEQVRAGHPDAKCEVWHGDRLIASISPALLRA